MLDECLSTVPQHQWISKLFGFDFTGEYQSGRLNTMADALSCHEPKEASLAVLSALMFCLYDKLCAKLQEDDQLCHLRDTITATHGVPWHVEDGLIQLTPEIGSSELAECYDLITSKRSSDDKGDIDRKQKRHVRLHRRERLESKLS